MRMRKASGLILAAMAVVPLMAITYGVADGTTHPNVGALLALWTSGARAQICSGTLISPTVFLTAAHCTSWMESQGFTRAWVTFDPALSAEAVLHEGTIYTNPGFNQSQGDPGDVAVIVFDEPVLGITPASLPPEGLFDRMKDNGALKNMHFTAVGYGAREPETGAGSKKFGPSGERYMAVSDFNALNNAWLRLSQNQAHGDGGTCLGDSGGPNFLGAGPNETSIIAGLTVKGDAVCVSTNVIYRLDTLAAREFLGNYVILP